ncbi:MAG TPA: POTRA domain-containing protein, partial [Vampirovibrionales bacterium]
VIISVFSLNNIAQAGLFNRSNSNSQQNSSVNNQTLEEVDNPLEEAYSLPSELDSETSNPAESFGNFDKAVTIKEIEVVGNQLVPKKVILDSLSTKVGSKFSRRRISYDLQSLNKLGYFDKRKLMAVPVPQGNEGVLLRIEVVENRPITGLIIKGSDLIPKEDIEQFLTPLVGMPRSTNQIRNAVDKIEKVFHDKGFLLASVTELHFDPDGFLTVSIEEGTIEAIEFEGNDKTKTSYLDRITPDNVKPGEAYNEENVIKFMEGLQRTGYFQDLKREIRPSDEDPNKHIITFKMKEQRTKSLSLGTGLGTLNGFFGTASFTEPNFRGQGESLSFVGQAGTGLLTAIDGDTDGRFARRGDFRFNINYADPFVGDTNVSGSTTLSAQQFGSFIVDSSIQRSLRGGASISFPIEKWGDNKWSFQQGVSLSTNDVLGVGSAARDTLRDEILKEGKTRAEAEAEAKSLRDDQLQDANYIDLTPSLVFRDINNNGTGWRNTLFAGPSIALGGSNSYVSAGVDLRRYERLSESGVYFKNAAHAESLLGDPASFRSLKMGGPYGMRGYRQFRDIGIGTTMLSNTAELSIPFKIPKAPIKDTKLVVFSDLGLVSG